MQVLKHLYFHDNGKEAFFGPLNNLNVQIYKRSAKIDLYTNDEAQRFMMFAQYQTTGATKVLACIGALRNGSFYFGDLISVDTKFHVISKQTQCTINVENIKEYKGIQEFVAEEVGNLLDGGEPSVAMPVLEQFLQNIGVGSLQECLAS